MLLPWEPGDPWHTPTEAVFAEGTPKLKGRNSSYGRHLGDRTWIFNNGSRERATSGDSLNVLSKDLYKSCDKEGNTNKRSAFSFC